MNKLFVKKKNELNEKKKKGFTLIELIIVIAIIAILAAVAIPKFNKTRENANEKSDISTAKNIATIVAQEVADGKIQDGKTEVVTADSDIGKELDGDIKPKAKVAAGSETFSYTVSNDGNVSVSYSNGKEVYPTWGGTVASGNDDAGN